MSKAVTSRARDGSAHVLVVSAQIDGISHIKYQVEPTRQKNLTM